MIPEDSRVEIDAKINAGYFTTGKQHTMEELAQVKGRGWEKWEDVAVSLSFFFFYLVFKGADCFWKIELTDDLNSINFVISPDISLPGFYSGKVPYKRRGRR
jgi:hypothetical protein